MEAGQKPDRRDQRRARPAAALAVADGAADAGSNRIRCSPATARCPGWRERTPSPGALGGGAAHAAAVCHLGSPQARAADRLRRSLFQRRAGATEASGRADASLAIAATTTRGVPLRRRARAHDGARQRGARPAAAPAGHRRRAEVDGPGATGRPVKVLNLGQDANERMRQEHGPVAFPHYRVRHARSGARRSERANATGAGADGAQRRRCGWRRPADDGRGPWTEARRRLGGAVGLQHRGGSGGGRRGGVRSRARLLLCRDPRPAGHQLEGALCIGPRPGDRPLPPAGRRSVARAARRCAGQ